MPEFIEGMSEELRVDELTGTNCSVYRYRGSLCPTVVLDSILAGKYAAYCLIREELGDASAWLEECARLQSEKYPSHIEDGDVFYSSAEDKAHYKMLKALMFSSVILYAKCFTRTTGGRFGVKLEEKNISPNYKEKHKIIMKLRNEVVAHSGTHFSESAELKLVLPPSEYAESVPSVVLRPVLRRLDYFDDTDESPTFSSLVQHVLEYVVSKIDTLGLKIIAEEVTIKPQRYWYSVSKSE